MRKSKTAKRSRPLSTTEAINGALKTLGYTTQRAKARVLNEDPASFGRYLKGDRSPQCAKVDGWLENLKRKGITIVLAWDADGCEVRSFEKHEQAA